VLVAAHWLLAALAYRLDWVGPLVKGQPRLLVRDGRTDREAMRRAGVSQHDLEQAVRIEAGETDLSRVREARLERDGSISVVTAQREPVVLEVSVESGVQTVRIRLE
jgi:Predicted membrane protein